MRCYEIFKINYLYPIALISVASGFFLNNYELMLGGMALYQSLFPKRKDLSDLLKDKFTLF